MLATNDPVATRPTLSALAAVLAVAGVLTACTPIQAQTAGGAGRAAAAPDARKDHVEADVRFMQAMIGHHEQALFMSALAPKNGAGERIQLLARKIDLSQRDEIALMKRWLQDRKQPLPDPHDHSMMHMPGMLTDEQRQQLAAARGTEFDRLFLTYMIQHHQGAITMVETLFAAPRGGQEPELYRFASDVDADQRAEIERMQQLLNALPPRRSPSP